MKCNTPIRKQPALPSAVAGVSAAVRFMGCLVLAGVVLLAPALAARAQAPIYQHSPHPEPQAPRSQTPSPMSVQARPQMQHGQMPPQSPMPPQSRMQHGSQHLGQWLSSHQNETPDQQQRSLAREPGFNTLPPEQQQRMQQRLSQLNSMPPAQRQRTLARMEAMERLTPDQRQQVRGALAGLGSLPPDQRSAVARNFRQLRMMPPDLRQQMLNSPRFRDQLTDQQRSTLNNLMSVEPYLPPPTASAATPGH